SLDQHGDQRNRIQPGTLPDAGVREHFAPGSRGRKSIFPLHRSATRAARRPECGECSQCASIHHQSRLRCILVFKGSRYGNVDVISPPAPNGKSPRVLAARVVPRAPEVLRHVVADGERLDRLANQVYGEATKYWLILDANPDVLNPFELLQTGSTIS